MKKQINNQNKVNIWKYFGKYIKKEFWSFFGVFLLSISSSAIAVGGSVVIQYAMTYSMVQDFKTVATICGALIGVFIFDWCFLYLQYFIIVRAGQRISHQIRIDLYKKINKLPISFFDQNKAGKIISNFTNDAVAISTLLSESMTDIIGNVVYFVGVLLGMFVISATLTAVAIVGIAVILLVMFLLLKKSQSYFMDLQNVLSDITAFLDEHLSAQALIDIYNQQEQVLNNFKKINKRTAKIGFLSEVYSSTTIPVVQSLSNILLAIVTIISIAFITTGKFNAFAGVDVTFDPNNVLPFPNPIDILKFNNAARLTVFLILLRNMISPLSQMSQVFSIIMTARAGAIRIADVLKQKEEYNDFEKVIISILYDKYKTDLEIKQNQVVVEPTIEFKNVTFGYFEDQPVLKNVSFKINKGDTIGIVGPTGSGKSTIINLITKMYEINDGDILIGDQSIHEVNKDSLRSNVSMVLQDTYFLNKTIKDNLKLAKPDATDEEIINACKLSNIHETIIKLKDGYETMLENNAEIFSKGEKQLLSIARAILHDVNILILDEATSSIDSKTEKQIQQAINHLIKDKTSIMIAHRLSTIRDATKILVIKDGELIEMGNHDELLELDGFYAKLYNSQLNMID